MKPSSASRLSQLCVCVLTAFLLSLTVLGSPALAQSTSDFQLFLDQIRVLEKYHTRKEVVGMVFRIYEPELNWTAVAPETLIYTPSLGPLAKSCILLPTSQQCFEETVALQTILYLSACRVDIGCDGWEDNSTGKRFYLPGYTPINMGHVFAGLSEEFFPSVGIFAEQPFSVYGLDTTIRTYIGDLGAPLETAVISKSFIAGDEGTRIDKLKNRYFQGMYDKYDIYADVDSYSIRKLLRGSPEMTVSQALSTYYGGSSSYDSRFTTFLREKLNDTDVLTNDIVGFALISAQTKDLTRTLEQCGDLDLFTECLPLLQTYGSRYMSPWFFIDIYCFSQEERGLASCSTPPPPDEAAPATTFKVLREGHLFPETPLRAQVGESLTATWTTSGATLTCRAYHQYPSGIFAGPWNEDLSKEGGSKTFSLSEPGTHVLTLDCYSPNNIAGTRKVIQVEVLPPLDLAFVIDTTGSMWDDIANVKTGAGQIVDAIFASGGQHRVAVADYRDFPISPYGTSGDYPFHVVTPFSNSATTARGGLQSLVIGNGLDWPESVYSGLMGAIQAKPDGRGAQLGFWRSSARKVIIVIGDAPPHDPEPYTGYRLIDVLLAVAAGGNQGPGSAVAPLLAQAQAADVTEPIRIYSIAVGGDLTARNFFGQLSEGSGGKLFLAANAADVVPAILGVIAETEPTANHPPDVSGATPSMSQLWPPNHQMVAVGIENVLDPDGDPVTLRILGVTSDEPVRSSQGDKFFPDATGVGTAAAMLRAERNGQASSRVYRISFQASDGKGGTATGHVLVCVPHDQGVNTACVDDGQVFDATVQ